MLQPKFTLTQLLLDNLSRIERLYGQLESIKLPKKLELNLERDNLLQSTHVSNSIEGNPLSLPEVTNLLLDDRVPVNRDEKEIKNYFELLKSLSEKTNQNLNIEFIENLHSQLMSEVNNNIAGKIRNKKVVVGKYQEANNKLKLIIKHEPPYHQKSQISHHLSELLSWTNQSNQQAVLKAGIFHHQYVYLHPFIDGNGRTCRLLTALVLLKNKYQVNRYFVLDDYYDIDREEYSNKLNTADQGDKTQWLEYFTNGVKYSLQSALERVKNVTKTLTIENRPTNKEQVALNFLEKNQQIVSADLANHLKVSRQQAHKLLSSLLGKGLIDKKGETKNSYYFLK